MASELGDNAAKDEGATVQAKPRPPVRKPHTLGLVIEAISQNSVRKGVSVSAIKKHLATQDPSVSSKLIKSRLRKALDKGFQLNLIVRPKGSEQTGISLSGRFLVNKPQVDAVRKGKKTSVTKSTTQGDSKPAKRSPTGDNMPAKKVVKPVKKSTANKENVAKTANKVVKAKTTVVKKTASKPAAKTTKTSGVAKSTKKTTTTKTTTKSVKAKTVKPKVSKTASAATKKASPTKKKPSPPKKKPSPPKKKTSPPKKKTSPPKKKTSPAKKKTTSKVTKAATKTKRSTTPKPRSR